MNRGCGIGSKLALTVLEIRPWPSEEPGDEGPPRYVDFQTWRLGRDVRGLRREWVHEPPLDRER